MLRQYEAREVAVGSLCIGGRQPVVIQSMTNTDTLDVRATVEQVKRLVEAGCELVRVTTPAFKHVEALAEIRNTLHKEGCPVPLAADVHFLPEVAVKAAQVVEKVRVNPGNYTDKPAGKQHYTESEHEEARRRIAERMAPLLEVCRAHGTAVRLGVNHGSLSERMLVSAPDVPHAMVASAMEFIELCEAQDFRNLVLSMKSSSVRQMREAVLLAVEAMRARGSVYPLHLGVTEAGNGLDGRLISAVGIGGLLKAGIGDTIRVSLTEAPEKEVPVARSIIRWAATPAPDLSQVPPEELPVAAAVAYADRLLQGDETVSLADTALTDVARRPLPGRREPLPQGAFRGLSVLRPHAIQHRSGFGQSQAAVCRLQGLHDSRHGLRRQWPGRDGRRRLRLYRLRRRPRQPLPPRATRGAGHPRSRGVGRARTAYRKRRPRVRVERARRCLSGAGGQPLVSMFDFR